MADWHPKEEGGGGDAIESKEPQRRPQKRLDRGLEDVAKAVGGGYCRLQMPLKLALAVWGRVAGRWAPWRGGGGHPPPSNASCGGGGDPSPCRRHIRRRSSVLTLGLAMGHCRRGD